MDADITNISNGVTYAYPEFTVPAGVTEFTFENAGVAMTARYKTATESWEIVESFIVSSIDFANGSGYEGGLDNGDRIVITFSEEIDPTSVHANLTKEGTVDTPGLNNLFLYVNSADDKMSINGQDKGDFNIGTFTVVGDVISRSNSGTIDKISLDATGKILALDNIYNAGTGNIYNDATDSLYIEFTPSASIKNKNGISIDTSIKVREPNGNKHF